MAKSGYIGEVLHFGSVRLRVVGSGNLLLYLRSLDNVENETLIPISMTPLASAEPTVLSLFTNQRAQLEFRIKEINEYFSISKIIVFVKPIATGYPL
jgi:hypothetical protein